MRNFDDEQAYSFEELDPSALKVDAFDVTAATFLIPSDAPIPSELSEVEIPSGSLYARLAALDDEAPSSFAFVPLSGTELLSLDRAWRLLTRAPKVYALFGLPGARYDILFTQASRQIGIQPIEWVAISEALADRSRVLQRTKDSAAWKIKDSLAEQPSRKPKSSTSTVDRAPLPTPEASDED